MLKIINIPANFNFQIGSIAENVLHNLYYNYAKCHAFTHSELLCLNSARIAWTNQHYISQ